MYCISTKIRNTKKSMPPTTPTADGDDDDDSGGEGYTSDQKTEDVEEDAKGYLAFS